MRGASTHNLTACSRRARANNEAVRSNRLLGAVATVIHCTLPESQPGPRHIILTGNDARLILQFAQRRKAGCSCRIERFVYVRWEVMNTDTRRPMTQGKSKDSSRVE